MTIVELAELFNISRPTVYRVLERCARYVGVALSWQSVGVMVALLTEGDLDRGRAPGCDEPAVAPPPPPPDPGKHGKK